MTTYNKATREATKTKEPAVSQTSKTQGQQQPMAKSDELKDKSSLGGNGINVLKQKKTPCLRINGNICGGLSLWRL